MFDRKRGFVFGAVLKAGLLAGASLSFFCIAETDPYERDPGSFLKELAGEYISALNDPDLKSGNIKERLCV